MGAPRLESLGYGALPGAGLAVLRVETRSLWERALVFPTHPPRYVYKEEVQGDTP